MLTRATCGIAFSLWLIGCDVASPPPVSKTYRISSDNVTVSGLSSGGYMASQLQLAFSQTITGVALLGAGPYYCSQGTLKLAVGPCLDGGPLQMNQLTHYARDEAAAGRLATLNHLNGLRVWNFHGKNDPIISADVSYAAIEFYEELADTLFSVFVEDIPAGHGFPTRNYGAPCGESAVPFILSCGFDAAGELLQYLLDRETSAAELATGAIKPIAQSGPGMADHGYLYVPPQCVRGECGLHIALHGCQQSEEFVGLEFVENAGYNRWADALDLLILYPQAQASRIAPMNPNGCWDWWGYTNSDFANRNGPQVEALRRLIESLSNETLF